MSTWTAAPQPGHHGGQTDKRKRQGDPGSPTAEWEGVLAWDVLETCTPQSLRRSHAR